MTDHPRTPDDDLIRDALHAEAADAHADDALLTRIRTATSPSPAWRRRTPLLAMAAALVVIAGLAAVLLNRDDDTVVLEEPATTDPGTTDPADLLRGLFLCDSVPGTPAPEVRLAVFVMPSQAGDDESTQVETWLEEAGAQHVYAMPSAEVREWISNRHPEASSALDEGGGETAAAFITSFPNPEDAAAAVGFVADLPGVVATSTTDCRGQTDATTTTVPSTSARPTLVALVREDGWLVTVDLETGEQRELHTEGDPTTPPEGFEEGGPQFIDAVDLSPDGEWIYFSTCCEPADGTTFRIPTGGGEVEEVGFGAYPRVSPDGRFVATAGSAYLYVRPTDDVGFDVQPALLEIGCCAKHLAWSPDGTELALMFGTGAEGETPQVRRFTWDGAALSEAEMGKPDNPGWFVLWNPEGMPVTFDGDPVADDRGLSQDRSFEWLLFVDEAGVVNAGRFDTGDIPPIPDLPEAIAADW